MDLSTLTYGAPATEPVPIEPIRVDGMAYDPTLPLIPEARSIRAPHQDEPRIGRSRRGGWVTRASYAPRLTTTQCSTPNGKPVLSAQGERLW